MYDAMLVGLHECVDHFGDQADRLVHRQLTVAGQSFPQGLPLDVGHYEIEESGGFP